MKFSGIEIIELAVQIEELGYAFYREMESRFDQPEVRTLFSRLGEEELNHKRIFREKLSAIDTRNLPEWFGDDQSALYFRAFVDNRVFPDMAALERFRTTIRTPVDAVETAIGFEKDTISFFHELWHLVAEKDRPVMHDLIREEQTHVMKLNHVKQRLLEDSEVRP